MLDALYPVYDVLKERGVDSDSGMEAFAEAAKGGAEQTRNLKAKVGRARYVQGRGVGNVDPGAFAVYLLLTSLLGKRNRVVS
jgi:dihydroxyacetone kinase-like protein